MSDERSDGLLRELGKELPWDRPDAGRRDAVRSSLLIAAAEGTPPARRHRWLGVGAAFAAGALAAAAAAFVLLPGGPGDPEDREASRPAGAARITASSGARLEHGMVATATGVDEIVRVRDGSVRVAVDRVRAGDRVRVHTGDAEVEGAGEYDVTVARDALSGVGVRSGSAEIRLHGQRPIFLSAGQTWRADGTIITAELPLVDDRAPDPRSPPPPPPPPPEVRNPDTRSRPPAPAASAPEVVARAPEVRSPGAQVRTPDGRKPGPWTPDTSPPDARAPDAGRAATAPAPAEPGTSRLSSSERPAGPPARAARRTSETERRFQAGWALLRGGKPREAAIELGAAAVADEHDPLAADARYFQAVALVRSGQGREAERVLVRFLDRAPRSLRRGRASVLLAQLIADRGDLPSARAWFQSAAGDPDPAVAAAARAGLEQLDARP
jgi:hypothetical protein